MIASVPRITGLFKLLPFESIPPWVSNNPLAKTRIPLRSHSSLAGRQLMLHEPLSPTISNTPSVSPSLSSVREVPSDVVVYLPVHKLPGTSGSFDFPARLSGDLIVRIVERKVFWEIQVNDADDVVWTEPPFPSPTPQYPLPYLEISFLKVFSATRGREMEGGDAWVIEHAGNQCWVTSPPWKNHRRFFSAKPGPHEWIHLQGQWQGLHKTGASARDTKFNVDGQRDRLSWGVWQVPFPPLPTMTTRSKSNNRSHSKGEGSSQVVRRSPRRHPGTSHVEPRPRNGRSTKGM